MKRVIFYRNPGPGSQPYSQVLEFDDAATEADITEAYEEWVWQEVGEQFTWYIDHGE
ncbi:hypothetical protein [Paenibacillus polymyxa]|uniref:hypothetical protein n=1 Tax=Paenibacillus polymyxa TaxID=1406 RepID=UPI001586C1B7|nr:hypothetical protein [Paenibacillus polymyxa]